MSAQLEISAKVAQFLQRPAQILVGGEWVTAAGDTLQIDNPSTGEVIAEVAGGTGGTGACIGCQGDGCFDGADGVAGEVVLAPWVNGAEASVLSVPQSGQLVLYY